MKDIYDYLENNRDKEKKYLIKVISKKLKVDFGEANKIYGTWKVEYMKPKFKATGKQIFMGKGV